MALDPCSANPWGGHIVIIRGSEKGLKKCYDLKLEGVFFLGGVSIAMVRSHHGYLKGAHFEEEVENH